MTQPTAVVPDISALMDRAIQHHRKGGLPEAENLYREILHNNPRHSDALHLLGVLAKQNRHYEDAFNFINQAIALNPQAAEYYNSLGAVYQAISKNEKAVHLYILAIQLKDDYIDAYTNLIRLMPDTVDARFNLGLLLQRQGKITEAMEQYSAITILQPSHAKALNNLGCAFKDLGQYKEAVANLKQAIRVQPDYIDAHYNLGLALQENSMFKEAIGSFERTLVLNSRHVEAHLSVGHVLQKMGFPEKAMPHYQHAVKIDQSNSRAYYNWASALHELGKDNEAIVKYTDSIRCDSSNVEAHVNMALLLLANGRYTEGWKEYEWRFQRTDWQSVNFYYPEIPRWDGSTVRDKTILAVAEQGFGDTLQFCRYLHLIKTRCRQLVVEVQPELYPLMAAMPEVDEALFKGGVHPEGIDYVVHLMSLPGIFGTLTTSVPSTIPYIKPPEEELAAWEKRIPQNGLRIGITWSGNPKHPENEERSCPLHYFAGLTGIPSVQLYSFQKGEAAEQLRNQRGGINIIDLGPDLIDFADTAAAVTYMDLIISVDTALVHLAGAMNKQVWTIRHHVPYWVWGTHGDSCPWYPSMRIFRQQKPGDWKEVFQKVIDSLKNIVPDK